MNILAIDFGLKRIGTAVGSTESGIAFAREVLQNDSSLWKKFQEMVKAERIDMIVIGMPYQRDGAPGGVHEELLKFVDEVKEYLSLPVTSHDERFTSKMAQVKLKELHLSKSQRQEPIDSLAAQIILQDFFDSGLHA